MASVQEQIYNPRNLFIYLSLLIITLGAVFYLKYDLHTVILIFLGSSIYWQYAYLTRYDPFTHSDCLQNGTSALVVLVLLILKSLHCTSVYIYFMIPFLLLMLFEFFNAFIIKEQSEEKSLWGNLILILVIAVIVFLTFKKQSSFVPSLTYVLSGKFQDYFLEPTTRGIFSITLLITLFFIVRFRKLAALFSHGPDFYELSLPSYKSVHIMLIFLKAALLTIAILLVGIYIGIAYYIIQTSKTRLALAESYIISLLYAFILIIIMDLFHFSISAAASLIVSYIFYIYYKKTQRSPLLYSY